MSTNAELFGRARDVIPGGVNSPVRAFTAVGGTPYFVARAAGARIWDVEGNEYLDLVQSYGAVIAGHAHPAITEAIRAAAGDGTSYGAPTEREVLLAEQICRRVPSVEKVRLVASGTEATMTALRVARGFTGRTRVVKFAGNYHGHGDALLAESGSAVAHIDAMATTGGVPGSAGVPPAAVAETSVVPYNVVPALDHTVACVIVEPVAANMGLVPPVPGFLAGLRAECDRVGALLVFDEVITGFRVASGGAQAVYDVRPDLSCFGKVIGGGLNVGAFGGRAAIMDELAPVGAVYQAGTLSGNPLATAAGLAALSLLDDAAYATLADRVDRLASGLAEAIGAAGIPVCCPRVGPLMGLHFGAREPVDYDTARHTDQPRYAEFFHAMLDRGVALAPGPFEIAFPGLAHDDAVIDRIVEVAGEAAVAVARG
ncbi:MAG TPA: glutamate-1-semialdehyde 2,1-aminomutase [Acidimicrobiales bacterium]